MKEIDVIMDSARPAAEIINDLMCKTTIVPPWSELEKEYNPKKHPVYTDPSYQDQIKGSNCVRMCRVTHGWQKLATKRMGELAFGIPVKRVYKAQSEQEQAAATLLEGIYRRNHINTVNLERSKYLYAGCEFATIWYTKAEECYYGGIKSRLKLRCKTYSPMNGDAIYPLFDDFDDLIALSVSYSRKVGKENVQFFETYTASAHARWRNESSGWVEDMEREEINVGKITGVYQFRKEPIWEDESENVYESEWELSRNGNYIRKNAKPNWVVTCDKEDLADFKREEDTDTTSRNVILLPKDAKAGYETWSQSIESLKFQNDAIRQNFFRQLQLPDMSFDSMKAVAMSGEARKMMFIDAQLKVTDEQGPWLETFERELNVIKALAKFACPNLADALDTLQCDFKITPYQISDELEKAQIASNLNGGKPVISQRTSIQRFGDVDDVDAELQQINTEQATAFEEIAY